MPIRVVSAGGVVAALLQISNLSPLQKSVFDNQSICCIKYINDYQQVASKLIVLICESVAFLTFWSGLKLVK